MGFDGCTCARHVIAWVDIKQLYLEHCVPMIHATGWWELKTSCKSLCEVNEPIAAPCVASTVQFGGRRVLAQRCRGTQWTAIFSGWRTLLCQAVVPFCLKFKNIQKQINLQIALFWSIVKQASWWTLCGSGLLRRSWWGVFGIQCVPHWSSKCCWLGAAGLESLKITFRCNGFCKFQIFGRSPWFIYPPCQTQDYDFDQWLSFTCHLIPMIDLYLAYRMGKYRRIMDIFVQYTGKYNVQDSMQDKIEAQDTVFIGWSQTQQGDGQVVAIIVVITAPSGRPLRPSVLPLLPRNHPGAQSYCKTHRFGRFVPVTRMQTRMQVHVSPHNLFFRTTSNFSTSRRFDLCIFDL